MFRSNLPFFPLVATSLYCAAFLTACDVGEEAEGGSFDELTVINDGLGVDAGEVQWPAVIVHTAKDIEILPAAQQAQLNLEVFRFAIPADTIAITSATGSVFPPTPDGIPTLDEPELSDGFMVAMKLHDQYGNLVGFGTEQEVIDMENQMGETTYTLTIPGRGTLMLAQEEDFTEFLGELGDMVATQDLIRTYDPPWVSFSTVPGTGRVVGGTGEFEGAHGFMQEIDIAHKFDLLNQEFDLEVIVLVQHW